ncbi:MAG: DUF6273 domain-containing protein [Oscillospiraceae bacterium]|nr:DUF6273 domain-containing protein [Oscillospiraceae bacterium]
MKNQIIQALHKIKDHFGTEIFNNPRQFKAILSDVPFETDAKKIRNLLNISICEMKVYSRLEKGLAKNNTFVVGNLIDEMVRDYYPDENTVKIVIETMAEELFGYIPVSVSTTNTPPVPNPQQPLNPQPTQASIDVDLLKQQLLTEIMGQISSDPQFSQKMPPQPLPTKNPGASSIPKIGSIIPLGGYDWRVLDVQNSKALLITKDVIEEHPYNTKYTGVTWEKCTLRQYLNGEFYNLLGQDKSRISRERVVNSDNPKYITPGGNDTNDKIFLLSMSEANKYFKNDSDRMSKYGNKASQWWLRSPGYGSLYAAYVLGGGSVDVYGKDVNYDDYGVRPALWLKI